MTTTRSATAVASFPTTESSRRTRSNKIRIAAVSGLDRIGEDGAVRAARRRGNIFSRRRSRIASGVAMTAIALAAWVGSLFGSGAFNSEARFGAERWAAQHDEIVTYGTPAVYGHTSDQLDWSDMVRKFVALDGVN